MSITDLKQKLFLSLEIQVFSEGRYEGFRCGSWFPRRRTLCVPLVWWNVRHGSVRSVAQRDCSVVDYTKVFLKGKIHERVFGLAYNKVTNDIPFNFIRQQER